MDRISSAAGFMLDKFSSFIGPSKDNNGVKDNLLPLHNKHISKSSNESTYYHPINPLTKKIYELCTSSLLQTAITTARSQPLFNNNFGLTPLQKELQKLDLKQRFCQKQQQVLQCGYHVKIRIEPDDYIIINMEPLQEKKKISIRPHQSVIVYNSPPTDKEGTTIEKQRINIEGNSSTLQQVIDNDDDVVIEYQNNNDSQKVEDSGDDEENAIQQLLPRRLASISILAHLRSDNEHTTTVVQLTSRPNSSCEESIGLTRQPSDDEGSSILSIPHPVSDEHISRNNDNLQQPFQFGYQPQPAWQQQNHNAQTYSQFGYNQQQQQQQNHNPTFNRIGFPQQQLQPQQQNTQMMMTFNPFDIPEEQHPRLQTNPVQPLHTNPNFNLFSALALLKNGQNYHTSAAEAVHQQPQIHAHLLASIDDRPWRPIRVEFKRHFSFRTTDRPARPSMIDKVIQFERRMCEYEESLYQELFGGDSADRTLYPSPPSSNDAPHQDFRNSQRRRFIASLRAVLPDRYVDGHYTEFLTFGDKCLGEGANGPVVVGRYTNAPEGGMVAIKRCKVHLESDDFSQTIREVVIMGKDEFRHPNITRVQNVFFNEDYLYMTMDLMETSLFDFMHRMSSGIPEDYVVYIIYEVVKALGFLHNQVGYFHGDIKSENILLGRDGSVKLTDFGLSYPVGTSILKPSGTTYWMAPEVADQERFFDEKADTWSLGMTMIELLDCGLRHGTDMQLTDEQELKNAANTVNPPTLKHAVVTPSMAYIIRLLLKVNPEMRPTIAHVEIVLSNYIHYGYLKRKTQAEFAALMEQYL